MRAVLINSYFSARARNVTSYFRHGRQNVWAVLINSSANRNARKLAQTSCEITKRPSSVSLMTPRKVAHSNLKNQLLRTTRRERTLEGVTRAFTFKCQSRRKSPFN
eukprot:scaffold36239_cov78-Attheya_sp.AAC.5